MSNEKKSSDLSAVIKSEDLDQTNGFLKSKPINRIDSTDGEPTKKGFALFRYPKGVFFVLGNEFAERFSYYGMTTILTLYIINFHHMSHSDAKLIFHAFHFLAYFTPILGSILADGFLGRFRVILYVSFAYCFGHLLLTLGSVPGINANPAAGKALDFIGLFIIAVATGGIKPCVVAFAADQFPPTMLEERKQFFSFFYFSINCGALLSTIITPIFRSRVNCYGQDGCYPLAFGVPAIFMGLALITFICGKPFYKIIKCEENIIWKVCKCLWYGLVKTIKHRGAPENGHHWLNHSIPVYGRQLVEDIKGLFSIMLLYVPVIFFWALFDQQGSTWVIQANRMNGRIGSLTVIPEQFGTLNPLLIITLIPLFERFLYPALKKVNLLVTPLSRMGAGGVLAAISFFIAGFLQLKINETMITKPMDGHVKYSFLYLVECNSTSSNSTWAFGDMTTVDLMKPTSFDALPANFTFEKCIKPSEISLRNESHVDFEKGQFIVFWDSSHASSSSFELEKTENSNSRLYPLFHPSFDGMSEKNISLIAFHNGIEVNRFQYKHSKHNYLDLEPPLMGTNMFRISLEICVDNVSCYITDLLDVEARSGEANGFVILPDNTIRTMNLITANTIHMFWQAPQYFLMTTGEMFFSISGLEFSYSQAAPSMKSVLQAIWLMTIAFGNVFDMIISGSNMISNPAIEFFVYATIMVLVMLVFIFLAYRYKYVNQDRQENIEIQPINSAKRNFE